MTGSKNETMAVAATAAEMRPVGEEENTPIPTGLPEAPRGRVPLPTPAPLSAEGFRTELSGASLWDLVQIECLAHARRVVQVNGEGGVGYLYFASGRVIHAVTPRLSGEAAALEILSWSTGAFQPCERGWPTVATIDSSHELLIMRAAKRRNDAAASNLVAFRGRGEGVARGAAGANEQREIREVVMPEMRSPNNNHPTTGSSPLSLTRDDAMPDFEVMIRVGSNGVLVKNKGGTEELAAVVAYTHRLVELVGDLLGLDRFVAMECTFKDAVASVGAAAGAASSRCLVFTEANGDTVALRPRVDSNIQPLRESLGLQ